jgi:MraZ protein
VAVFVGTYRPKLDEKGRLILPAKFREFREEGTSSLMLTKGREGCIVLLPTDDYMNEARDLQARERTAATPEDQADARMLLRTFTGNASEDTPDRQGRITVPPQLREFAGIEAGGPVAVVGAFDRIEIWNEQAWTTYQGLSDHKFGVGPSTAALSSPRGPDAPEGSSPPEVADG